MSIEMPGPEFDRLVESLEVPDEAPAVERLRRRPRRCQPVAEFPELVSPAQAREIAAALLRQADEQQEQQ